MGLLKCYEWIVDVEAGTKISAAEGLIYNGVILGIPLEIDGDPDTAEFDDSMFPNGRVENVDGIAVVTPDEEVAL
jgi:hypothetical protein